MPTPPEELRARTKQFAILIVRLFQSLPKNDEARIMGKQVLRAGTSVAANYRAVCRARSRAEFVSKMGVVVEEADETVFWLEILVETGIVPRARMETLLAEANELLAIFAASYWTARAGQLSQWLDDPMAQWLNDPMTR
jgi:four helix bundle protein